MIRVAIYYAPPSSSQLARAATNWLGRENRSALFLDQPEIVGINGPRLRELTRDPFHYGFHGTLKPPFHLLPGVTVAEVAARLEQFAAQHQKIILPQLKLRYMHDFFCLRPDAECRQLEALAGQTVRYFDEFRLASSPEELQKRRGAGLSVRQEKMLTTWGYPYVMEEFRFHLTLTARVIELVERELLEVELKKRFPPQLLHVVPFDSLCLFAEYDRSPMVLIGRFLMS